MTAPLLTLQQRLTATIDAVNAIIGNTTLPCRIDCVSIEAEGRLAVAMIRYDDGIIVHQPIAAAMFGTQTLLEAVYRSVLLDHHLLLPLAWSDEDEEEAETIAYATDAARPQDHQAQTHPTTGAIQ